MKIALLVCALGLLAGCQRAPLPAEDSATLGLPALPAAVPPSNQAAVELGRKLFMDRRLSRNNTMSCAMCHVPEHGFAMTQLATPVGIEGRSLRRNAPTLLNVAWVGQLFHDGRAASLESQAWDPLLNPIEMGNEAAPRLIEKIQAIPDYAGRFEAAFGGKGAGRETVAAALAAYQRSLVSGNSRFDRWRYGGDKSALNPSEQAGFAVFAGKGRCIACHTVGERSALFSDAQFHNTGIGRARSEGGQRSYTVQLAPGVTTRVSESELGSVSEPRQADAGREEVSGKAADRWAYRTPGLRNVALTPPYMHDGSLATLEAVIDFYQRGGIDSPGKDGLLRKLALTPEEKRDLAAFLRSLSGNNADALARQARAAQHDVPSVAP